MLSKSPLLGVCGYRVLSKNACKYAAKDRHLTKENERFNVSESLIQLKITTPSASTVYDNHANVFTFDIVSKPERMQSNEYGKTNES